MGRAISSPAEMVSYAGDLRRAAKQVSDQKLSETLQRAATQLEKVGLAKVGQAGPGVGALLDTFV